MEYTPTFKLKISNRALIEYYSKIPDPWDNIAPQKIVDITNEQTIGVIVSLTNELPDEGQIMKKLSNETPLLRITLFYPHNTVYFEYYGEKLKTPATSFYASDPAIEKKEKELYDILTGMKKYQFPLK